MPRIFKVKTFPKPRYRESVELSGQFYELVWTWRSRTQGWYVDVFDQDGEPIALGRRVRAYTDALSPALDIEGKLFGVGADYYASPDQAPDVAYVTE